MPDYALTAAALRRWQGLELPDDPQKQADFWADLLDAFGPALFPFVVKPEFLSKVPYRKLGLASIDVGGMTPGLGESWLLFCFSSEVPDLPTAPVRSDGLLLPCEWRQRPDAATHGHSPLLAASLSDLADQVRTELNGETWYLYPSFARFAERVSFTDPALFAPANAPERVASAWGALAVGLYFAQKGLVANSWPFSSLQYDACAQRFLPVEGIVRKMSVAAGFSCRVFMVAPSQVVFARAEWRAYCSSIVDKDLRSRLRELTVSAPVVSKSVSATVEDLATGTVTRRRRRTFCGAVCAGLAALGLAYGCWHYAMWVCPTTEYYATAFRCRDGWEGSGRLTASEAAHRVGNVRFVRQGRRGRLAEVAWVDGKNQPTAEGDLRSLLGDLRSLEYPTLWQTRSVRVSLAYEKEGRSECAYDAYGRETYRMKFQETRQPQSVIYTKNGWLGASDRQSAKQIAVWYGDAGRVSKVRFLDDHNPPRAAYNFDGVAGYDMEYGVSWESVRYVDADGTAIPTKDGCCRIDSEFDGKSRVRRTSCYDADGCLTLCSRGYAVCAIDYDGNGNPSAYRYFDASGNPVSIPTRQGNASELAVRYMPGDLSSRLYVCYENLEGQRNATCAEEMHFDECGYVKSRKVAAGVSRLDGDPSVNHVRFDRKAPNLVYQRYLDLEGRARTNDLGVASERMELNDDGMVLRSTLLGLDGKPVRSEDGVAVTVHSYEGFNLSSVEGFDENGQSLGVKVISCFDDRNLRVSTEHVWTNGCPIVSGGYWKETFRYNKMRSVTEHAFFLPGEGPATNAEGFSRTVVGYSAVGNQITHLAYWYGTNHLVNGAEGYASLTNGYDEAGNLVLVAFYDAAGKAVRTKSGYLIRRMRYDSARREIERLNVDEAGALVDDATGRARYVTHYGADGQNLGATAYDAKGMPRLPLMRFRKGGNPEAGICLGDILLACDQWRYSRISRDPMGLSLTNGTVLTGLVLARRQNGGFRLIRSPTSYRCLHDDLAPCCFPPDVEDFTLSLLPSK